MSDTLSVCGLTICRGSKLRTMLNRNTINNYTRRFRRPHPFDNGRHSRR